MPSFQVPRSTSRLIELDYGMILDLPFDLQKDPDQLRPNLLLQRSQAGNVETMPRAAYALLRLLLPEMDDETLRRWRLLFDRSLQRGRRIEVVRDSGRYFWLAGDSARDIAAGQMPVAGSTYTLVSQGGAYGQGALAIDRAQSGTGPSRQNLVSNGDFIDGTTGATPTGWTVNTPSSLQMTKSTYLQPNGHLGAMAEFVALTTGTKTASLDFTLDGNTISNLPGDLLYVSGLIRSDGAPATVLTDMIAFDIVVSGPATLTGFTLTPTSEWVRFAATIDTSGTVVGDTTVELILTLEDVLQYAPLYLTELQVERGALSAFLPYSTVRTSLTGARAAAEFTRYVNRLAYGHQLKTWADAGRWAFTVALVFAPHWSSGGLPATPLTLYQDGDAAVATTGALRIHVTTSTIVATAVLDDGTAITATKTGFTFAAFEQVHILATFRDWDGSTASSGTLALYVNGTIAAAATTHSKTGVRQGKFFWLGSTPNNGGVCAGEFSDVALDPVFVDGSAITVASYISTAAAPVRPDRNSWRAVMDPGQRDRSDNVEDNMSSLDVALQEVVTP